MASQYDNIGAKYDSLKKLPAAALEEENFKNAVQPYLSLTDSPRVLDLACGTGHYSHKLPHWGAAYVLGVDQSHGMITAAEASLSPEEKESKRVEFQVGNASGMGRVADGGFDLVIGVWLLNYAASQDEMAQMFETISANLVPGGAFVGVTPNPAADLDEFARKTNQLEAEQPGKWGASVKYLHKLASEDGWRTELRLYGDEAVTFRNYHLSKTVYEAAARQGGMGGRLEWKKITLPPQALENMGQDYWDVYFDNGPHLGILVVKK